VKLAAAEPATPDGWVLKGGLALELCLGDISRSTRDLDLAIRESEVDGKDVRNRLLDALAEHRYNDHFTFAGAAPRPIAPDLNGRPGWRFPVNVSLAGRTLVSVRLDVVARAEEIDSVIEQPAFRFGPAFVAFSPWMTVPAIDVDQHAAEEFHAVTRQYGVHPNIRVKDLVDPALLIEHGLVDPASLRLRMCTVFTRRAGHEMPDDLPDPPAAWRGDYLNLIADLDICASTADAAMVLIHPVRKAYRTSDDHN
jgi:hypothetical protein